MNPPRVRHEPPSPDISLLPHPPSPRRDRASRDVYVLFRRREPVGRETRHDRSERGSGLRPSWDPSLLLGRRPPKKRGGWGSTHTSFRSADVFRDLRATRPLPPLVMYSRVTTRPSALVGNLIFPSQRWVGSFRPYRCRQ